MRSFKKILFFGAILHLSLFIACTEDEYTNISTTNLLAGSSSQGRSYFISSAEIDLRDVNGTLILERCVTDNTIIYYPNGRYEENEGRTKCNVNDPPGSVGTWTLLNNDTQVSIRVNGVTELWDIVSVNNSSHRLTRSTNDGEVTFVLERLN